LPAPEEAVVSKENFGIIPANDELYAVEIALQSAIGSEATLLDALEEIKKNYDFVVIDSNPYIGCLTLNAVSAADGVIIPVSPALFSASGLKLLLSLIIKIKKRINKELSIYGVLFTQTNSSETATKEIVPAIKTAFDGIGIFKMQIPKTQAIANANNNRCSVFSAEGKKAAEAREAFEQLAKSVIKKGKENA
jgi:chromosome partitioning protein